MVQITVSGLKVSQTAVFQQFRKDELWLMKFQYGDKGQDRDFSVVLQHTVSVYQHRLFWDLKERLDPETVTRDTAEKKSSNRQAVLMFVVVGQEQDKTIKRHERDIFIILHLARRPCKIRRTHELHINTAITLLLLTAVWHIFAIANSFASH